jgi:hypothetical protein
MNYPRFIYERTLFYYVNFQIFMRSDILFLNGSRGLETRNNRNSERKLQKPLQNIQKFYGEGNISDDVTWCIFCYRVCSIYSNLSHIFFQDAL